MNYWEKRQGRVVKEIYNLQEKKTINLLKLYKEAQKDMEQCIVDMFLKYSEGGELTYTEMSKYNRLTTLYNNINNIVKDLGNKEVKAIRNDLIENYHKAYEQVDEVLKAGPGIEVVGSKVNKQLVEKAITYPWSGSDFKTRSVKNKEYLARRIRDTITRGFVDGKSVSEMTKELKTVTETSAYEARRLIRSETSHIINSATHDRYKMAGIEKVQFLAAADEVTCDDCGELDGGEPFILGQEPMLPIHPNCRCTYVPYFEDM